MLKNYHLMNTTDYKNSPFFRGYPEWRLLENAPEEMKLAFDADNNTPEWTAYLKERFPWMANPFYRWDGKLVDLDDTTAEDGAPYGNKNAAGPHKKKGATGRRLSDTERKKIEERLAGQKSSKGTVVTAVSSHAFDRVGERMISIPRIEQMLASTDTKPDKTHADRTIYDIKGSRLVLADNGTIISVMWRKQNK